MQKFSSGVYVRYLAKGLHFDEVSYRSLSDFSGFAPGRCIGYLENNIKSLLPDSCYEQAIFLCDLAPHFDDVHIVKYSFGVLNSVRRRTIFRALQHLADTRGIL